MTAAQRLSDTRSDVSNQFMGEPNADISVRFLVVMTTMSYYSSSLQINERRFVSTVQKQIRRP